MAILTLDTQTVPAIRPRPAGFGVRGQHTKKLVFCATTRAASAGALPPHSSASLSPAAATDTWITDSGLLIPSFA